MTCKKKPTQSVRSAQIFDQNTVDFDPYEAKLQELRDAHNGIIGDETDIRLANRHLRVPNPNPPISLPLARCTIMLCGLRDLSKTGPGRWIAKCPAHADKNLSLAISESDAGVINLFCAAGCSQQAILEAMDMTIEALWPDQSNTELQGLEARAAAPVARPDWMQMLEIVTVEARICALGALDVASGRKLKRADSRRLILAADKIANILQELSGSSS